MYVVAPTTIRTCPVLVGKCAVVTVDRSVGDEEDLDMVFGSAGTELEDMIVTFTDEESTGNVLCACNGIVWQEKLNITVVLTDRNGDIAGRLLLIYSR